MFKKNSKPVANPTLQSIAANAPAVSSIAGAAAAIGMAVYWINEANKSIRGQNTTPSQQAKVPAEKKQ